MSDRVNQLREALSEFDTLGGWHGIKRRRAVVSAARDFADLLTRLEDSSLVEKMARAWLSSEWPELDWQQITSHSQWAKYKRNTEAALAALGLQEDEK